MRVIGRMQGAAGAAAASTASYGSERLLSFKTLMLHPYYVEATFNYEELVEGFEAMRGE